MLNNPIRFNDPTGHRCEPGDELPGGYCYSPNRTIPAPGGETPNKDKEKQDSLFSIVFSGSGPNGLWTASDWEYYYANRDRLWEDPESWINPETVAGWDLFVLHVKRLAAHYAPGQQNQFVTDFGLMFAGITDEHFVIASIKASNGPDLPYLSYTNEGLDSDFFDSKLGPNENQTHHYAGIFYASYYLGEPIGQFSNVVRDLDNPGDVGLGEIAAADASEFWWSNSGPRMVADMIYAVIHP